MWWHDNLNALRKSLSLAKRNWKFNKTESSWKEVVFFKNKYFHAIWTVKQVSWTTFLQRAAEKDVFTAYHFIKSRKVVKISSIQHENSLEITFQEKFKMFLKTMFSSPSESTVTALKPDDLNIITWKSTNFKEVEQTIKFSSFRKASKSDRISFLILQQAFQAILRLFFAIFVKLLNNSYHSTCWCQATDVILRKDEKSDYSALKTYQIIMLLNCLNKISEKIIVTRLSKLTEVSDLLYKD